MDKSIIALILINLIVSDPIISFLGSIFCAFSCILGMVPLPNDFIGLVTLEFVGLFQFVVTFLSAFNADGNVSF